MRTPDYLAIAHEAVDLATGIMAKRSMGDLTYKTDRDFATEADYEIEDTVRVFLAKATPGLGFRGEERGVAAPGDHSWVLDPIDGTVNYHRGLPMCAVSLALVRDGDPHIGVIDLPFMDERYAAELGRGATLNRQPIRVGDIGSLDKAVISFGDFATGAGAADKNIDRLAVLGQLAGQALRVRMLGSAATDFAWLARGRTDAVVVLSNHPWDVAAGVAIAREAGAKY